MKNINLKSVLLLAIGLLIFIYSCKKTVTNEGTTGNNYVQMLARTVSIVSDLNPEGQRIFNDIKNAKYNLTVMCSYNFGNTQSNNNPYIFGGTTPTNFSIEIDGNQYSPAQNGGWYRPGSEFESFFGKNIEVKVNKKNSSDEIVKKIYYPQEIHFTQLSTVGELYINRVGNTIAWNTDNQNPSGQVVLSYKCFDNDNLSSIDGIVSEDILVLDDNGNYNIDGIISNPEIKRIELELGRGNGFSINDAENGNTFFNIKSSDFHTYLLK